jgi:hypothetical protein
VEFGPEKRLVQTVLQQQVFVRLLIHLVVEEAPGIAAGILGVVHGDVGLLQQAVEIVAILGKHGDADAAGRIQHVAVDFCRFAHVGEDLFGDPLDRFRVRDVVQQQDELVAPLTTDRVGLAHAVGQTRNHLQQQLVACGVSQRVVHPLELVQIEEQQGDPGPRALRHGQRMHEAVAQQNAVGQAGQCIVVGQKLDALLRVPALGDIAVHPLKPDQLASLIEQLRSAGLEGAIAAVPVLPAQIDPLPARLRSQGIAKDFLEARQVVGMNQTGGIQRKKLLRRVAQNARTLLVAVGMPPLNVDRPDPVGGMFRHGAETRFALAQRFFGALALGDVLAGAVHAGLSILHSHRPRMRPDIPRGAVPGDDAELAFAASPGREIGDVAVEFGAVVRVHVAAPAAALQDLVHRVAEDLVRRGRCPVDHQRAFSGFLAGIQQVGGHAGNQPEALLAFTHRGQRRAMFLGRAEIGGQRLQHHLFRPERVCFMDKGTARRPRPPPAIAASPTDGVGARLLLPRRERLRLLVRTRIAPLRQQSLGCAALPSCLGKRDLRIRPQRQRLALALEVVIQPPGTRTVRPDQQVHAAAIRQLDRLVDRLDLADPAIGE